MNSSKPSQFAVDLPDDKNNPLRDAPSLERAREMCSEFRAKGLKAGVVERREFELHVGNVWRFEIKQIDPAE